MANKRVFVSYCHGQGEWTLDRLVPCLTAGGAEVLIDVARFKAGKAVVAQMDQAQDDADVNLLLLSDDYLNSKYCRHEMDRAVARDSDFQNGVVIPVRLDNCKLPQNISRPNPLVVDLRDDKDAGQWKLLMEAAGADPGTDAPHWLKARDDVRRFLERNESVNLVVRGNGVAWRPLIDDLLRDDVPIAKVDGLAVVDLQDPDTFSRGGLVTTIIRALGGRVSTPAKDEELAQLKRFLQARGLSRVALTHFDLSPHLAHYEVDLFAALRYLTMEDRTLVLLIQSHTPLDSLLPKDHPLSKMGMQQVELEARP